MELLIKIGEKEVIIYDTILNFVAVALLLSIFALIVNKKAKSVKVDEAPSGFFNMVEMLIETIDGLVKSTMGEHNMKYAPYILTIFVFILTSNLLGLIGFASPTSDYSVTFAFAMATFVIVQISGVLAAGGLFKYLKSFFEPYVLLSPLNIIGELANPVSLSFRLFGNILSGGLIMTLLYSFLGYFAPLIAPVFHIYFDIFAGGLQAFIFTMLTMVFIGGVTEQ